MMMFVLQEPWLFEYRAALVTALTVCRCRGQVHGSMGDVRPNARRPNCVGVVADPVREPGRAPPNPPTSLPCPCIPCIPCIPCPCVCEGREPAVSDPNTSWSRELPRRRPATARRGPALRGAAGPLSMVNASKGSGSADVGGASRAAESGSSGPWRKRGSARRVGDAGLTGGRFLGEVRVARWEGSLLPPAKSGSLG